jgi:hypothetical protein
MKLTKEHIEEFKERQRLYLKSKGVPDENIGSYHEYPSDQEFEALQQFMLEKTIEGQVEGFIKMLADVFENNGDSFPVKVLI